MSHFKYMNATHPAPVRMLQVTSVSRLRFASLIENSNFTKFIIFKFLPILKFHSILKIKFAVMSYLTRNWKTSLTCKPIWRTKLKPVESRALSNSNAQYTPPTPTRRNCRVASRRRRWCVHEFATRSRRLPIDSAMWTQPSAVTQFTILQPML